jgi:thiol-disulfide isomerase/thioredoxin
MYISINKKTALLPYPPESRPTPCGISLTTFRLISSKPHAPVIPTKCSKPTKRLPIMKIKILALLAATALLPESPAGAAATDVPANDLSNLVAKVKVSLSAGKRSEASQTDNLKEFDALLAKYKGQNSDAIAQIAFMKAALYLEVFNQRDKAMEMLTQLQKDFPGTESAKKADEVFASIKAADAADKIQAALAVDTVFPDFDVKDLDGKPLALANYKGKVVMIDFWATWCGPCVGEVPNVADVYQKYHDKGFEIIGVSLDREGDKGRLTTFIKEHHMPWRQFYDGKYWQNELAVKYGVHSIPATYLLDGSGKIIAKNARGDTLEPAVKKALGIK